MHIGERVMNGSPGAATGPHPRSRYRASASRLALAAGLAAAALSASGVAAVIRFDEPAEGSTRACVETACATSAMPTVIRSVAGVASQADIVSRIPAPFQPLINLFELQSYHTRQTIGVDLVNSSGTVVNTLIVDFAISELAYSAGFTFSSDAGGPLSGSASVDVLAADDYQDLAAVLQSQLDLSGVPFPFGTIADFLRDSFFPISVNARSGALDAPAGQVPLPATAWLFALGFAALLVRPRQRSRTPSRSSCETPVAASWARAP